MITKIANTGSILVLLVEATDGTTDINGIKYNSVYADKITCPNQEEADKWCEVVLNSNANPYPWLHPDRPIRVVVNNKALTNLSINPATSAFIPYVHQMLIPVVETERGIEIYLEEFLPMPGVDDVQALLELLGCKIELK